MLKQISIYLEDATDKKETKVASRTGQRGKDWKDLEVWGLAEFLNALWELLTI